MSAPRRRSRIDSRRHAGSARPPPLAAAAAAPDHPAALGPALVLGSHKSDFFFASVFIVLVDCLCGGGDPSRPDPTLKVDGTHAQHAFVLLVERLVCAAGDQGPGSKCRVDLVEGWTGSFFVLLRFRVGARVCFWSTFFSGGSTVSMEFPKKCIKHA